MARHLPRRWTRTPTAASTAIGWPPPDRWVPSLGKADWSLLKTSRNCQPVSESDQTRNTTEPKATTPTVIRATQGPAHQPILPAGNAARLLVQVRVIMRWFSRVTSGSEELRILRGFTCDLAAQCERRCAPEVRGFAVGSVWSGAILCMHGTCSNIIECSYGAELGTGSRHYRSPARPISCDRAAVGVYWSRRTCDPRSNVGLSRMDPCWVVDRIR